MEPVVPEVKTISVGSALMNLAIFSLTWSTAMSMS